VQWDKDDCADMGIVKVDLLGLGMMAVLQDTFTLINKRCSEQRDEIELARLPPDDPAVYRMLRTADTIGVFQVESRAQMATLPRLRPERFYDIVVAVAIVRPGPIVGQMVHPYMERRSGQEPVKYPHPSLEPILRRTLGVPLFQEQLLRVAMVAAGFSGGQAEELRRAFGFGRSERRMAEIEVMLREGMARRGITGEPADQIVRSITSFALYGFPESHAASFALLVYASAYLKAHYPAAFFTALLNNQPMGFYHPATLVKDAQRRGVRFAVIDVQHSDWDCSVSPDGAIRLGLRYVAGLREEQGRVMEGCGVGRTGRRRFTSIEELIARTGLRRDELTALAEVGALNAFGCDRRTALWQIERAVRDPGELFKQKEEEVRSRGTRTHPALANHQSRGDSREAQDDRLEHAVWWSTGGTDRRDRAWSPLTPMTPYERVVADYAGTGLTIGSHPVSFRRQELALRGVLRVIDLSRERDGRRVRVAGTVITRQRPETAKGFVFLTLEDETGIVDIIVKPGVFATNRVTILERPFLLIEGVLQLRGEVTSVKAERFHDFTFGEVTPSSRDFH